MTQVSEQTSLKADQKISNNSKSPNETSQGQGGGPTQMKREISLFEGTALTIGSIIGSGIFISPKGILEAVGSVGLSLTLWIGTGVVASFGAMCYTELGTTFTASGGDYHYLHEAFGPIPAFLFLWALVMIFIPCNNVILALTFAQYVTQGFSGDDDGCSHVPPISLKLLAAVAITFLTFLNCFSARGALRLQNVFGVTKVLALLLIILGGLTWMFLNGTGDTFEEPFQGSSREPGRIVLGFFSGIYAYGGANALNHIVEEVREPKRTLPTSIYISMTLVIVLYLLVNIAYFSVLTPAEILNSDAVAVSFGNRALGPLRWCIPILVGISTFGGLGISIMVSSRILFVGTRNGHFPKALGLLQISRSTPTPSLVFMGAMSLLYLYTPDVYTLINYSGFMYSLVAAGIMAALMYLRWTRPDLSRPIKVHLLFPLTYFIISLLIFILPLWAAPQQAIIGATIVLTGLPVYALFIWKQTHPYWLKQLIVSTTSFIQKLFLGVPEIYEPLP